MPTKHDDLEPLTSQRWFTRAAVTVVPALVRPDWCLQGQDDLVGACPLGGDLDDGVGSGSGSPGEPAPDQFDECFPR